MQVFRIISLSSALNNMTNLTDTGNGGCRQEANKRERAFVNAT